ncbi:hypothetical protein, partial [Legionella drancourtii]
QKSIPTSHTPLIGALNGEEQNMHGGGDRRCNSPTHPCSYGHLNAALQQSPERVIPISEPVDIPPQKSSSSPIQGEDKDKDLSLDQMSPNIVTSGSSPCSPGFDLGFETPKRTNNSGTPGSTHSSPGFGLGLETPKKINNSGTSGSAHSSPGFGLGLPDDSDLSDAGSPRYSPLGLSQ